MARSNGGSVRMGPISVFSLVIMLCLAVMGMLAVSTGHASMASAEKQAANVTSVYANESQGWTFVAGLDTALAEVRANGGGYMEAVEAIDGAIAGSNFATRENDMITASFSTEDGKQLQIVLEIKDNATLEIVKWEVSTLRDTDNGDILWSGM